MVTVGGTKYLIVSAFGDNALSSFEIEQDNTGGDGFLTHVQSIFDGAVSGPLLNGIYQMESVVVGAASFVIAASYTDDSLSVYRVAANGQMTLTDTISDSEGANLNLDNAYALTTTQIGNRTFVYTGTYSADDGISVFELSAAGNLTSVQNVEFVNSVSLRAMTVVQTATSRYLVAANNGGQYELFIYEIAANGTLTYQSAFSTYYTAGAPQLYGVVDLETYTIDGATFVIASANSSDTLAIYSLDDDGVMSFVNSLTRTEFDGSYGLTTFVKNGRHFIAVTGQNAGRVSVVEIGGADDPLVATSGHDKIVGLDGDDDLVALGGDDSVYGGRGDDVMSGRAGDDFLDGGADNDVLIGGAGNDTLRGGSGADIMIGNAGSDAVSYAGSAAAVNINMLTGVALGGDAAGDVFFSVEGLIGSSRGDTLAGNDAANSLYGDSGNDNLSGRGGVDFLYGGVGNDSLSGGDAGDRLYGEAGNDTLLGEAGSDILRGGAGNDSLTGDTGNDVLVGDAGNDVIIGGLGDDTLDGGTGADIFVFLAGQGADQINGFAIAEDKLDLSALPGINSLADFQAASISFGGNTVFNLPDGSSIFLIGVLENQFTTANFIF